MAYLFQLHPDLRTLLRLKYISATDEQLTHAIENEFGESVEIDFIPGGGTREEFVERFIDVIEKYYLVDWAETLFYICLREAMDFEALINHHSDIYESRKRAKQLAKLLVCFEETKHEHLLSFNLITQKTK